MSGGFFRGTSADQDTRFSNKHAQLMKSQKFPPELEHLVDVTKVSMDVMRPWIANRVTELLGFEDEVLINFIYGLLDGKVNGKEVQIQLTGFMEKNTGKFMKELWTLLLSARKNASGVPQQFLDAKQEETKKRKEEADRLANEIQRKKDKETQELEEERSKKMDGGIGKKASNGSLESNSKHTLSNASSDHSEDEKITDKRNGVRAINGTRSPSRSISKSHSNSRSDYGSRSVSRSLKECKRSVSFERVYYSPRRQSITPRWRRSPQGSFSPKRGRSSSFSLSLSPKRGRSRSFSLSLSPRHRRSPSPFRRHRLPSPFRRRRSPSPTRCRRSPSPTRCRRSPSPTRCRRSPSHILHCRSPSLVRRRRLPSPMRHRISPLPVRYPVSRSLARRYISPSPMLRRRSPSPLRHNRSPSPVQHSRSPSAVQRYSLPSSVQRASCSPARGRSVSSPAPVRRRSPSLKRRSPSLERGSQRSPSTPQHGCVSHVGRRSPFTSDRRSTFGSGSLTPHKRCPSPMQRGSRSPLSRKSPEQKRSVQSPRERGRIRTNEKSPRVRQSSSSPMSRSPPRCRIASEDKSPYKSHVGQAKELMTWDASSSPPRKFRENRQSSEKEKRGNHKSKPMEKRLQNSTTSKQKDSALNVCYREYSPERFSTRGVVESRSDQNDVEIRSKDQEKKREKKETPRTPYLQKSPMMHKDSLPDERKHPPYPGADGKSDENRSYSKSMKGSSRHHKSEFLETSIECVRHSKHGSASDYGSEEMDKHKDADKELRKHKRSRREAASDDDHSYDSDTEDRKEAKRRMKEENRLQKEKKRQQREERCWKRLERRAEKQKGKNQNHVSASDGEDVTRMECYSEDTVSEQKRLETELRKKALESLKTKKGISH